MSHYSDLHEIADLVSETDPALACRLSARMAESVAVEHLSRYRRART